MRIRSRPSKTVGETCAAGEPIAIIGMGCRFPGATNPEAFWRLLRDGVDAITEVPADRWDINALYDPDPSVPGKTYTRWGGFLDGVDQFDARFFHVSPGEADEMDPQQRLLLEVTWEAVEHAGLSPECLAGTNGGVFIGIGSTDYIQSAIRVPLHLATITPFTGLGNAHSIAANRLSYLFDLRGPSVAVDTACSSSLVALHLACQSLRRCESDLALAGGVNMILCPDTTIAFSKARMMAPDGRCKVFDAAADGYVRSEGCGIVVLKRLADALRDGDHIAAVVRGTAVNQDGRTTGLSVPNGLAQQAVIRAALADAGVESAEIDYVEAHGTGTKLGDPIEVEALTAVFSPQRREGRCCLLGSVKANVGHLEVASGIAGLMKVVLSLQNEALPGQQHFSELNPKITLDNSRLAIATEARVWRRNGRRRIAGVNSFGFGGTNAHVVVEEAPQVPRPAAACERPQHLLCLSAKSDGALRQLAERYRRHVAERPAIALPDLCYTAATGRAHFAHRLAVTLNSVSRLDESLAAFADGSRSIRLVSGRVAPKRRPKVAFLFTGQGVQRAGMGYALYDSQPTFRAALDRCAELLRPHLTRPLLEILYPRQGESSPIDETEFTQPALFALEYALATLLAAWGIRPGAVLGHSVGELVAACVAGVFDLADGVALTAERARLMQGLPRMGGMAAVRAGEVEVTAALASHADRLSIAAVNGPRDITISGEREALDEVLDALAAAGVVHRRMTVSHAFHSPLMEPMLDAFEQAAERIVHHVPQLTLVSNVSGKPFDGRRPDAPYWRRHVREPVRFAAGLQALIAQGYDTFVELGPHPTLIELGKRCVEGAPVTWVPTLRRDADGWETLLDGIGRLYIAGVDFDWAEFDRDYSRRRIPLPTYPFERTRHWRIAATASTQAPVAPSLHPLLGHRLRSAAQTEFAAQIGIETAAFLKDHQVQGSVIFAAAAYIEMALAAAREVFGPKPHALEELSFQQPFFVPATGTRPMHLLVSPPASGQASFRILSQRDSERDVTEAWTTHVTGRIRPATADDGSPSTGPSCAEIRERCREEIRGEDLYAALAARGLTYGPSFRGVQRVWCGEREALAQLHVPRAIREDLGPYLLHPATLDATLHGLAAAMARTLADALDLYLPVGVGRVRLSTRSGPVVWSHAVLREDAATGPDIIAGDVRLLDQEERLVATIDRLQLRRIPRAASGVAPRQDGPFEIAWEPTAAVDPSAAPAGRNWLVLADRSGIGAELSRLLAERGESVLQVETGEHAEDLAPGWCRVDPGSADDLRRVVDRAVSAGGSLGVVHLWSLDVTDSDEISTDALVGAQERGCESALLTVQALAAMQVSARLWLVTRGAQAVGDGEAGVSVAQAPLWGLGRVVSIEHPELRCRLVDLDGAGAMDARGLLRELDATDREVQVALRGSRRLGARVIPDAVSLAAEETSDLAVPDAPMFGLTISSPGNVSGLALRPAARRAPTAGLIEIDVQAAGLNFRDVMNVMGLYPGGPIPLGAECAGRICRVGDGVDGLRPGDEVVAVAPASFARFALTSAQLAIRKPSGLSWAEAVTIPITFLTAYYALHHLARMVAAERVLIHAAAGGVGLAAVQLAQRAGAEVFATAGNAEKRAHLTAMGVPHVMDSRSLDFADEIMERTSGAGVDIVLNSLAGHFIPRSLAVLGAYGRFLEIGKTDIYLNSTIGLYPFQNNLSYHAIDLDRVCRERPALIRQMLLELAGMFARAELQPLPRRVFPIAQAPSAFRYMMQRRNIGKVVLSFEETAAAQADTGPVRADGTYLITGGLGGIGLEVASWLVGQGARTLVLVGRREPSDKAALRVRALEGAGARVVVAAVDVAERQQVVDLLARVRDTLPPLRGVVHAAGVLDDGRVIQLDRKRLRTVMAPKIAGAWNLHTLTLGTPLDFFLLFSSIAGVLGSAGQANYAAANAFLDALAHHRRARGLPALAIDWGPWAEIGMAARDDRTRYLALTGMDAMPAVRCLAGLETLLRRGTAQAIVADADWQKIRRLLDEPVLLSAMAGAGKPPPSGEQAEAAQDGLRELVLGLPRTERQPLLEARLRDELARVLGIEAAEIDLQTSLDNLGIDSLTALELKETLESGLHIRLPMETFMEDPSVANLANAILVQLDADDAAQEVA